MENKNEPSNNPELGNKSKPVCVPCMSRTHAVIFDKNSKIQILN